MTDSERRNGKSLEQPNRRIGYVLRWEIADKSNIMSQVTEVEVNDYRFIGEQRSQQLEQVAKRMLDDFKRARLLVDEGCRANALTVVSLSFDTYKEELEALGVNLDD